MNARPDDKLSLLDLLDRVLEKGVVLDGRITLAVADIDLVEIDLRVVLAATETLLIPSVTGMEKQGSQR